MFLFRNNLVTPQEFIREVLQQQPTTTDAIQYMVAYQCQGPELGDAQGVGSSGFVFCVFYQMKWRTVAARQNDCENEHAVYPPHFFFPLIFFVLHSAIPHQPSSPTQGVTSQPPPRDPPACFFSGLAGEWVRPS